MAANSSSIFHHDYLQHIRREENERRLLLTYSRSPTFSEEDEQQKRAFTEMYGRSHNGKRAAFE